MTDVTLQILEGLERGKVFSSLEPPFTIGREISNTVPLNDESVSRYHTKIQQDNDRIILTDLGSTNGTRVNGHPVQLKVLKPGDQIHIGRCILLFGSFKEIDELLSVSGTSSDSSHLGLTTQQAFHLDESDGSGSQFEQRDASLDLFPQGCPELPSDLNLVQRAQVSDLLAYMHHRLAQLISESSEEYDEHEERETRVPWHTWQRMMRTELDLAQALQKISDPE